MGWPLLVWLSYCRHWVSKGKITHWVRLAFYLMWVNRLIVIILWKVWSWKGNEDSHFAPLTKVLSGLEQKPERKHGLKWLLWGILCDMLSFFLPHLLIHPHWNSKPGLGCALSKQWNSLLHTRAGEEGSPLLEPRAAVAPASSIEAKCVRQQGDHTAVGSVVTKLHCTLVLSSYKAAEAKKPPTCSFVFCETAWEVTSFSK